jgi:hypothetical protein
MVLVLRHDIVDRVVAHVEGEGLGLVGLIVPFTRSACQTIKIVILIGWSGLEMKLLTRRREKLLETGR